VIPTPRKETAAMNRLINWITGRRWFLDWIDPEGRHE
jgi:hypothetical protein